MKDKTLQICRHLTTGGSFATALFHFLCCGLPAVSALLSGTAGFSLKHSFLTHAQMGYMLIFSGFILAVSFYFSYKKNCCASHTKGLFWCRAILYFSLILYVTAVYFHCQPAGDSMSGMMMGESCH